MQKDVLQDYIVSRLTSVEQQLYAYQKDKNPEHLHRLRVEIKKTRAVFSFAKDVYKQKYTANKLMPLFHKAGKIREIKLHIHLLNTIPHLPKDFIAQFKKQENILEQQFIKNISRYFKDVKIFREGISLPVKLPDKKTIKKYFKKEQRKANKEFETKDRKSMHRFRIKIKKMMYLYTILPKKLQKEIELNKTEINQWQKQIGEWHDTYSAIAFLSHQDVLKNTTEYISKLNKKESRQFNALLLH